MKLDLEILDKIKEVKFDKSKVYYIEDVDMRSGHKKIEELFAEQGRQLKDKDVIVCVSSDLNKVKVLTIKNGISILIYAKKIAKA